MRECICPYCGKKAGVFHDMWDNEYMDCRLCKIDQMVSFMPKPIYEAFIRGNKYHE